MNEVSLESVSRIIGVLCDICMYEVFKIYHVVLICKLKFTNTIKDVHGVKIQKKNRKLFD